MAKRIEIEMPPFSKARPRVTRDGTRTYMPTEYQNKRDQLRLLYQAAGGEVDPEGAIALRLTFVLRMPKSWSKKKKESLCWEYCQKTPDIDNLVGAVMDSLVAKDQNVVDLTAIKVWGFEDKIIIEIKDAI